MLLQYLNPGLRRLPPTLQAKAVGCDPLASRLARLRPAVHLFAHSHFAWDANLGGTRYVQAPLCYPAERTRRGRSIRISADAAAWRRAREAARRGEGEAAGSGGDSSGSSVNASSSSNSSSGDSGGGGGGGGSAGSGGGNGSGSGDITDDLPILLYEARFCASSASGSSSGRASSRGGGSSDSSSSSGGGGAGGAWRTEWAPSLGGLWSEHYRLNPREPWVTTLAPWVAARYARRQRRLRERSRLSDGTETEAE
jgi:hypothetical protein